MLLSFFCHLWLLIDPVELGRLPALNLLRLEPQSNLLLCALHAVGAVANVAADIDGIVTTDGTWGGLEWVGSAEDGCSGSVASHGEWLSAKLTSTGLAGVTTLPDHGDDWTAQHV